MTPELNRIARPSRNLISTALERSLVATKRWISVFSGGRVITSLTRTVTQTTTQTMSSLRYSIAPAVNATSAPPIPKAKAWAKEYLDSSPSLPLLDLSQGVPRDPPSPLFIETLNKVNELPSASQYGPILGEPALREAFAGELRALYRLPESSAGITGKDVGITTGCNMAFLSVLQAICSPKDSSVLLPLPAYFNHEMSLSINCIKPVYIPADPDAGFAPTVESARAYLESAEAKGSIKPKMIVLVTPSNPTGSVFSHKVLREWYDLAREYGLALVLDETYRDFVVDSDGQEQFGHPHDLFQDPDWRSTLISLGSFSKGYRIPGHRLGSVIAAPELLNHIATILDCMQITAPRPPQLALVSILPALRADLLASSIALAKRRALFKETVEAVSGWKVCAMGGYYAYVSFPDDYRFASSVLGLKRKTLGSEDIAKLLALRVGVTLLPGAFFMPSTSDDDAWDEVVNGEKLREDKWLRFAVANVTDEDVVQLGPRLGKLNEIMGIAAE